ncbi:hypothetical protein [Caldimonas tepidiphila]|uniref:hypothetical protein n=1 Tax=Caldimonas tepidiphila TaxID=2315841 RepID=UPI001300389A|nr:hypothetical protein [Caldimonas tepidiphila]
MPRWLAALLLVALLPWQSLAWAADTACEHGVHEASHAVAHWLGEAHHHHDDGSVHEDDSVESLLHLHADSHLNSVSVLPAELTWLPSLPPSKGPPSLHSSLHPAPFLEGLRRPPRIRG